VGSGVAKTPGDRTEGGDRLLAMLVLEMAE
jgi:hypothetical protein